MATTLPLPPSGVPFIDPATGGIHILWQNYLLQLESALTLDVAPKDAQYWLSTANTELTNERNIGSLSTGYLKITTAVGVATPSSTATIPASDIGSPQALSRVNDTNVTLTLGGTPTTALLQAVSLTMGWTGALGLARGGTNADLSGTGGTSRVLRQSSAGATVTVSQLSLSDISGAGTTQAAYGVGTAYVFTNTAAAINFGTTDPDIVITAAGTYVLYGQVLLAYNAATVVAETASVKIRRTNNTAADVGQVVVIDLPVSTTLTNSFGIVALPPVVYTTANTDDALALFGNVSAALGAGSIDATAVGSSLVALRIV